MRKSLKTRRLFTALCCAGVCVFALCTHSFAQEVPADSVLFDSVSVTMGQPAVLTARLVNTETLIALSLPLNYLPGTVSLDSVSWVSTRGDLLTLGVWDADSAGGWVSLTFNSIFEPYIIPGNGILAEFYFSTSADAVEGSTYRLDTAFIPPANELIVRNDQVVSRPLGFVPGIIKLVAPNDPPTIAVNPQYFVDEGQPLEFTIEVTDPEGQPVTASIANAPPAAAFTEVDPGIYSFAWTPDFVGAFSAAANPFTVTFHATDGVWPVTSQVEIWVNNVNRPPELTVVPPVTVTARDTVRFTIGAVDPDEGPLTLTVLNDLDGDTILGDNPWTFLWVPSNAYAGEQTLAFEVTDEYAATDTTTVDVTITAAVDYHLYLEQESGVGGEIVEVDVSLFSIDAISGIDLLIRYDDNALTFAGINRSNGGTEGWELFDVVETAGPSGKNIHLIGNADLDTGATTAPLPPGDTLLFALRFSLSDAQEYYNQSISLSFYFGDINDNILLDTQDNPIVQEQIVYTPGGVHVQEPEGLLVGDVNLNGTAFEIGDAVRFISYFMYGTSADFGPVQRLNSDCNQDGITGSVADLVYLITVLTNGTNQEWDHGDSRN